MENDLANCGVTVHLVDEGIDTGLVLGQARIVPTKKDSFVTYPYLQIAAALPLLDRSIQEALHGELVTTRTEGPSKVWYHPGLFQYARGAWRGIR